MDSVGADNEGGPHREVLLQMSRMDKWVAWPSVMVVEMGEKERWTHAALRRKTWQCWGIWH